VRSSGIFGSLSVTRRGKLEEKASEVGNGRMIVNYDMPLSNLKILKF
jgi:hypothetical protein